MGLVGIGTMSEDRVVIGRKASPSFTKVKWTEECPDEYLPGNDEGAATAPWGARPR